MFKKWMALLLATGMIFTAVGCGTKDTASQNSVNYGDEVFGDEFGDDEDQVVINKSETTQNDMTASYGDDLKQKYVVDESKKESFLKSVPKELSGKEVSILTWWSPFDFEKKKMERFTEETGIKIKWIYADGEKYLQRLAALKAQGNSPDLACINVENYPTAILQDYFQPLSVGKLDLSKTDVYDIGSMDLMKWNSKYYGAIVKGSTRITMGMMMYNADIFLKYGVTDPHTLWKNGNWNWDTFIKTAQDIQQKSGVTAVTGEYQGFRLAQTCGEDAVAIKDGKIVNNTSSQVYRNAYKWLNNLNMRGQYKIIDFGINRDGFMDGKSAMMIEETWALQKGERYENLSFKLGYAPLPCQTNTTIVPSDAQLWGFPVGAKNVDAASYAMEYWMNPVYDEAGYSLWVNNEVASFCDWLWEQPKCFKVSEGVIGYGGDYEWSRLQFDLSDAANSDVDSVIDRWSGVIDNNIKKIYKEFG